MIKKNRVIKFLKWVAIVFSSLIILIYALNLEYILKGVRVIYLTGHNTAFISDYKYFDNREIKSSNPQPWALHKITTQLTNLKN